MTASGEVRIRRAVAGDVPAIAALARAAYAGHAERMGREPAPMGEDYPAVVASAEVFVATYDAEPVGYLVLRHGEDHTLLENLGVAPEQQGRGLGSTLVAYAERHARERGHRVVRLYTHESMTANLRLYAHLGYAETARVVEDGFRRVYLGKALRG